MIDKTAIPRPEHKVNVGADNFAFPKEKNGQISMQWILGQILLELDLDQYYTAEQIDQLLDSIELDDYYTKGQVDDLLENINLDNYYTKSDIDGIINIIKAQVTANTNSITAMANDIQDIQALLEQFKLVPDITVIKGD
jgi:hypothetical protein